MQHALCCLNAAVACAITDICCPPAVCWHALTLQAATASLSWTCVYPTNAADDPTGAQGGSTKGNPHPQRMPGAHQILQITGSRGGHFGAAVDTQGRVLTFGAGKLPRLVVYWQASQACGVLVERCLCRSAMIACMRMRRP